MRLKASDVRRIGLGLSAACALATQAEGQEYCVACTEPSAMYRCVIEGARPGGSQPLQMLCATAMAKEGQHATCSVKGGTVFDCNGPVKRVPWAAYNEPAPKANIREPAKPQTSSKQPAGDPDRPPRTVEEMAKRANQQAADQMQKNNEEMKDQVQSFGQKVGDTTKKTWRCITSFFTQCTE